MKAKQYIKINAYSQLIRIVTCVTLVADWFPDENSTWYRLGFRLYLCLVLSISRKIYKGNPNMYMYSVLQCMSFVKLESRINIWSFVANCGEVGGGVVRRGGGRRGGERMGGECNNLFKLGQISTIGYGIKVEIDSIGRMFDKLIEP